MKKTIIAGLVLTVLFACSKDKFQTNPQISLKLVTNDVVPINGSTTIELNYTDKEGDISDTLFLVKLRQNKTVVPTINDTIAFQIPSFPKYDKGEISVPLSYQTHLVSAVNPPPIPGANPPQSQPDTLIMRIWIHDEAGHPSDTITTGKIIVIR